MDNVIGFIWKAAMFVATIAVIMWVLSAPQQSAGLIVSFVGGVASFVETTVSGVVGVFR